MKCKMSVMAPSSWLHASMAQRLWTTLWATLVVLWWAATHTQYICRSTGLCDCPGPVLRPAPRPEPWCQAYNQRLAKEVAANDAAEVRAPWRRPMPHCLLSRALPHARAAHRFFACACNVLGPVLVVSTLVVGPNNQG